jgi:hypothetical protein
MDGARFQVRTGNRSEYYAKLVKQAEENRWRVQASERARFWFAVRVACTCVLTTGIGLFMMGWALHTTDMEMAQLAWTAGPIVGNGLTLVVLGLAAVKWERDEW